MQRILNVRFQKNPYPPQGKSLKIPRGRGVLKVKILEAIYEAKLEFPGGGRVQNKKPSVGGVWIFSGTAQLTFLSYVLRPFDFIGVQFQFNRTFLGLINMASFKSPCQ